MPMPSCDHEVADTRMCIHVQDSLEHGAIVILVRTADTDVIVILVEVFFQLQIFTSRSRDLGGIWHRKFFTKI